MANIKSINGNPIVLDGNGISENAIGTAHIMDGTITEAKLATGSGERTGTVTPAAVGWAYSIDNLILYEGIPYVIKCTKTSGANVSNAVIRNNDGTINDPLGVLVDGGTAVFIYVPENDMEGVGVAHYFASASGSISSTLARMEDPEQQVRQQHELMLSEFDRLHVNVTKDWFVYGGYNVSAAYDATNGWVKDERKRVSTRPMLLKAGTTIEWSSGPNNRYITIGQFKKNSDGTMDHRTYVRPLPAYTKSGSMQLSQECYVFIMAATGNDYSTDRSIEPSDVDSTITIETPYMRYLVEETHNMLDMNRVYKATGAAHGNINRVDTYTDGILNLHFSQAGGQYWLEFDGTLPAGTYTLSSKVRFDANASTANRNILMGVGEGYTLVVPKSGYNGAAISPSELEGFVYLTVDLESESDFRIILEAQVQANQNCEFYEMQLEAGDVPTPYVNHFTAIDYVARSGSGAGYLTSEQVAERTFNASYHTGADDFASKCTQFSTMMYGDYLADVQAPSDCEAFLFFTDPHLLEKGSEWEPMMREYVSQIQKYYNSTPTTFCLAGGDWLGNSDLPSEACFKMGYIDGFMHSMFNNCYMLVGNHDTNYQGKIDAQSASWTTRLSDDAIRNLWYRGGRAYYEFMGGVTRFFCFDTGIEAQALTFGDNYGWEQAKWFADSLATNTVEHVAIAAHILYYSYGDQALQPLTEQLLAIAKAFNDRGSITVNDVEYDYANAIGKVEFGIFGHNHRDAIATVSGIPCLITTWVRDDESYGPTFDLVFVDYDSSELKTVRVGSGDDRTMAI